MPLKGFKRRIEPIKMLSDQQVEEIHRATLEVLNRTGIRFESKKALKLFEQNDCQVDYENMRVRFPPAIIEECVAKTPSNFYMKSRRPDSDLMIGGNTVYFCSFPGKNIVDLETWEPRVATLEENDDGVRILDALENVHFLTPYTPYFEVQGVPSVMAIIQSVASKIRYSTKLQFTGHQKDCDIFTIQIAQATGTEIQGMCNPAPPLTYPEGDINSAFRFLEAGFSLHINSGGLMGATAPATIAGSLVTSNAEIIGGIVLAQLIKPGARIIVCDFALPQNMRTGYPAFGAIEGAIHAAMFNQMWRRYGVPTQIVNCAPSSSKKVDFQCGYEKGINALLGALSGAQIVELHGGITGELTYHPAQAILDDDIAGMIGRFIEGAKVSDETIVTDLINAVGPIPGMFLDRKHTMEWWKAEQYIPKVADRLPFNEWKAGGKKDALAKATERMEQILSTHKGVPLPEEQDQQVEKIMNEARKYYKDKGLL